MTPNTRNELIQEIRESLSSESEIRKIVIFGSFLQSDHPHDIDIAIFQDSKDPYLFLAMKYRKLTRKIAQRIPLDVIPIKYDVKNNWFLSEINSGELIYER